MRLPLLLALLVSFACESTPVHRAEFADGDDVSLGGVTITERGSRVLLLENTGLDSVVVGGTMLRDATGDPSVDAFMLEGSTCLPGLRLQPGELCDVEIAFEPGNDIAYADEVAVHYRAADTADAPTLFARVQVRGTGVLDCRVREDWSAAFDEGAADAEARIATEVEEGRAAGEALTRSEGVDAGYRDAYARAYDTAYDLAYADGHADGYGDGYNEAGSEACYDGELAGDADGFGDGYGQGESDGSYDGDAIGYEDGYSVGAQDGEYDGCGFKVDPDASLVGKCVEQGYAATYSGRHYHEAFAAAAAANAEYQAGLEEGRADGTRAGREDGDANGYAIGYEDGADLGFVDGYDDLFYTCYENAYAGAFAAGYDEGYADGYAWAYDGGYAAGYDDGYAATFIPCDG